MTLTARLSAFFLTALALVLAGFAITLYVFASSYLHHQIDSRLAAALDAVSAATEIQPQGIEWEGMDHPPPVGRDTGPDEVRWMVQDERGRVVSPHGRSVNLGAEEFLPTPGPAEGDRVSVPWKGQLWRVAQRRLQADPPREQTRGQGRQESDGQNNQQGDAKQGDQRPKQRPSPRLYPALVVTAAVSLQSVGDTLRNLALTLTGLSVGLWVGAALLGRWLCRRALRPLSRMAVVARSMSADDLANRLPCPQTRDELEDLGHAFNDLLARLHEAFERQRRFTGDASHQLRTPLTILLGQIEVALRRERSADAYREVLALVHGQAGRLRQIVEMLLFLARADAEARLPNLETVDLAHWLPEHLAHWAEHARAADLRLECADGAALRVRAHAPLLSQLLDNLLDNACKYSEPGTPIHIRAAAGLEGVTLTVEDSGEGIAAADLPYVFEPFYRSTEARGRGKGGVGLGLAVVQRIATALGGTVTVRSQAGEGSQFIVQLPVAESGREASRGQGGVEEVVAGR